MYLPGSSIVDMEIQRRMGLDSDPLMKGPDSVPLLKSYILGTSFLGGTPGGGGGFLRCHLPGFFGQGLD